MMTHNKLRPLRGYALLVAGFVAGLTFWAVATTEAEGELDTGRRVIPYTGTLKFDGQPVNGNIHVTAILRGTLPDAGQVVANVVHRDIAVRQGAFHVNFGANDDLPASLYTARNVEVALFVENAAGQGHGAWLGGATAEDAFRRIRPHAFAYWAASASDLHVEGDADLAGVDVRGVATIDTVAPMSFGNLVPGGRVETPFGGTSGVEFQRLGQTAASLRGDANGPDLNMNVEGGAGIRFRHAGTTLAEITANGFEPHVDVKVPSGKTFHVVGDLDMVHLEDERSISACNETTSSNLGDNNDRRFCALVGYEAAGGSNGRERCEIKRTQSGRFQLSAFSNRGGEDCVTCRARCIRW